MTKPLLWYPWKWEKWAASYPVSRLSWGQRGLYRELLDASWKRGGIPDDPEVLAELARGPIREFRRLWPAVRRFWHKHKDGLLYNDELEEIRAEQLARHAALAESGRRGGQMRAAKRSRAQASLSKAQAREESRVETTLRIRAGRGAFVGRPPAPIVPDCTGIELQPPPDPPTHQQIAELAEVRRALREQ